MRFAKSILLLLVTVVLLAACGLKGPLYLPEEEGPGNAESQQGTDKEEKEEEEKEKKDDKNL